MIEGLSLLNSNQVYFLQMERSEIIDTLNRFFIAVDMRHWQKVTETFEENVHLDYTSMAGGKPTVQKGVEIVESWKSILPGFDKTHHQVGNMVVEISGGSTQAFCYRTASHFLGNPTGINLWTVVGSYEFDLLRNNGAWRISKMKFNLKYIDGNQDLPQIAQKRVKSVQGK